MTKYTEKLNLFEYEPEKDGKKTFNITQALNENFDKLDSAVFDKQDKSNLAQTLDTSTTKYPSCNAVKTAIDAKDSLPSQAGNSGKFLNTDGTVATWKSIDLSSKVDNADLVLLDVADLSSPDFSTAVDIPTTLDLVQCCDKDCYLSLFSYRAGYGFIQICDVEGNAIYTNLSEANYHLGGGTVTGTSFAIMTPLLPKGTYFKFVQNSGLSSAKKIYKRG